MATLRELFAQQEYVFAPLCYDPLTARLAEEVGFQAVYLGGGSYGSVLTWTEAMLTVTELAEMTHRCSEVVDIPVIIDAAAGFGEPLHVMRTVRELEHAGGAALEIEDQIVPKRAHHHKGFEHMIPKEAMVDKVHAACEARKSTDFLVIGRTNAIRNTGLADAIERAQAYREAGADIIFALPRTEEEITAFAQAMDCPLMFMTGSGRLQNSKKTVSDLATLGYCLLVDATSPLLYAYQGARRAYESLLTEHTVPLTPEETATIQKQIQTTIRLPEYWEIERRTVEKNPPV